MKQVSLCLWCLLGACVPDLDVRSSIVVDDRLLAVIADPPEVRPGAMVRLAALAANAAGPDAAPAIAWTVCHTPRPSAANGSLADTCLLNPSEPIASQAGEVSVRVPLDACARFGPDPPPGDARPRDPDGTGGFYQPLVLFTAGSRYVFLERLVCNPRNSPVDVAREFAARYLVNQNPPAPSLFVLVDGAPQELGHVANGGFVPLVVRWDPEAAEPYVWIDPVRGTVAERREALTVSWFATGGAFEVDRSEADEADPQSEQANGWTAPSVPGRVVLWAVLRDDRGGASFVEREVEVEVTR